MFPHVPGCSWGFRRDCGRPVRRGGVVADAVTRYLNQTQAAEYAAVDRKTIWRARVAGHLRFTGDGRLGRTTPEWVDDWLARRAQVERNAG